MSTAKHVLMLMAGGTGGHIFPGLAIAHYMRERGWEVVWLGNKKGMEGKLVPQHAIPMHHVAFGGLRGKGLFTKLLLPFTLLRALYQSYKIIRTVRPNVVLGMGGYISFPGGLVARCMGLPLVTHEQNAIPGLTNRLLAKLATQALCAFPDSLANALCVGNPVRRSLFALPPPEQRYAQRSGPLHILVVGGSLGATALNQIVPEALALLPVKERPSVTHQSGAAQLAALLENYAKANVEVKASDFIEDMAEAYAEADLVICRAGAMTVAEIAAAGVAALFIPFPFAVDDHQTHNAKTLAQAGGAFLEQQRDLTAGRLAEFLRGLTRKQLTKMAVLAKQQAKPKATTQIARACALAAMPGYYQSTQLEKN
jgi:UDP-N-acetylglucosamine--N-acetylmuramyl-(pentapeptide) pyrophosphoryl-undecaprenol N-acetylglucosamine transferase